VKDKPTYQDLLDANMRLSEENRKLREEVKRLKDLFVIKENAVPQSIHYLSLNTKVALFKSLFKGREDVFARRWYSKTNGKSGYQPVCLNEWNRQLCDKRKYKCAECPNRQLKALGYDDVYRHLEGRAWNTPSLQNIVKEDFPEEVSMVMSNMLYLPLKELSAKVVNHLKRIASFKNPEFYSRQGMRLSTYNVPRIISCAEIQDKYLALPRGCKDSVIELLDRNGVSYRVDDKTQHGTPVSARFKGTLREDQEEAVKSLVAHKNGVLNGTTAFGKTVAAIGLIAGHQVNTLILVHTKTLLDQWKSRLEEFLDIDYIEETTSHKRGRKKMFSPFGTLDSKGNSLHGMIDVALMQSCIEEDGVKSFVRDYGMIIVDECHHVSAVTFERILKFANACNVYGLTATPIRKDGHQPIIFMQCGPIRYSADAEMQMTSQTFDRLLVSRFTSYRELTDDKRPYTQTMQSMSNDEQRNNLIVGDVCRALGEGRSPVVLTSFTSHVSLLAKLLSSYCLNVVTLVGSESVKEKRTKMEQLQNISATEPLVIIATGRYVGEGFDYPRLDTLFLALPVSWKGIVAQYAGRLHREYPGKKDVQVYDYIDIHVPLCYGMEV